MVDSRSAWYGWEHPYYPQFHIPDEGIDTSLLTATGDSHENALGRFELHDLHLAGTRRGTARQLVDPAGSLPEGYWFIEWSALDDWFEEDERVYSHPRSPYVRVDAIRSTRDMQVRHGGETLASAASVVSVFETGLPPRYYFDPTAVRWELLQSTDTTSVCPYKGFTSGYWTVADAPDAGDIAWSYGFPTRELSPIAGLVAFDDRLVEITDLAI